MQVKKFEAPTIQEALETIKRELGPEAIILQTKKNKRGFGLMSKASVEVTAAVSDRSLSKVKFTDKRLPDASKDAVKKMPAKKQADLYDKYLDKHLQRAATTQEKVQVSAKKPAPGAISKPLTATRYADISDNDNATQVRLTKKVPLPTLSVPTPELEAALVAKNATRTEEAIQVMEEMRHLKRMLEEIKNAQDSERQGGGGADSGAQALIQQGALAVPALQEAFERLVISGVDKRYAYSLIKNVGFELGPELAKDADRVSDQLAAEIMRSTEVKQLFQTLEFKKNGSDPTVIALVGPTGVGKTTTVAKMASEAILRRNLKVGLINLDSYKVAAFDQLGTYAKILNVPFRSVATVEDLQAAIQDFRSLDMILVDTTGRSQRDPSSLKEMRGVLSAIRDLKTHLVLSVTTRDTELYDMANRFSMFSPQGIIVSKLDEATIYGAIYNVSQKVKLPLLYFTTGQRVPEDIEEATRERVAALILDIE